MRLCKNHSIEIMEMASQEARDLTFEERFGIMVEKEWMSRKNSRIKKLLHSASLGMSACIEDIDYTVDRKIDKKVIQKLSTCSFIEQKLNVVITGKTGCGKFFISCALGNNACRHEYSVSARYPNDFDDKRTVEEAKEAYEYICEVKNVIQTSFAGRTKTC